MPSRMEKYYKTDLPRQRSNRSSINKHLYDSIYEKSSYTNIESIATIDKPNEIDINQIRKLITPEEKKERRLNDDFGRNEHKISIAKDYDSSAYDIRDVLNKAKTERKSNDTRHRSLRNTQYDILKNLDVENEHSEKEELKELFNTITSNSKLNKLGDKELSLDMFDSLKSNGTNVDNSLSIQNILSEKKGYEPKEENELDKSFFTSSLGFKDDDFEEMKDMNVNLKRSNILMKIFIFIFSVALLTGIIFAVYEFLIK